MPAGMRYFGLQSLPVFVWSVLLFLTPELRAQDWEVLGPNSRVMKHRDGSKTYYRRTAGQKVLVKKNVSADGKVRLVTHYYMDDLGNPRSCKIYNGSNKLLYKVSYGYQISTGRLMKERMFFADKKDPKTGKSLVASETRYTYDSQGNRSKPMVFTFVEGRSAETLFGRKTTLPDKVFKDQGATAQ